MQIWPYPYNIGRKAYLGTADATRTERDELSEYNTDRGVTGTSTTVDYSFQVYGATENTRQTVYNAFIAVSSNADQWTITVNPSKAIGTANQFVDRSTTPVSYTMNRAITSTAIQDRTGKQIHYELAELQGVIGTEINVSVRASAGSPTLYYAYFTGSRILNYEGFTRIQETYLDPGLVVRENLYGGLSKQRLVNSRRRWKTDYDVFISPNTPLSFQTWFSFLQSRLQSDRFLFAEDAELYPWRVYPAIVSNTEEVISYLNSTKRVYSFPLTIEEI